MHDCHLATENVVWKVVQRVQALGALPCPFCRLDCGIDNQVLGILRLFSEAGAAEKAQCDAGCETLSGVEMQPCAFAWAGRSAWASVVRLHLQ